MVRLLGRWDDLSVGYGLGLHVWLWLRFRGRSAWRPLRPAWVSVCRLGMWSGGGSCGEGGDGSGGTRGARPMSRMQMALAVAHLRTKKDAGERLGRYQMAQSKKVSRVIDHNTVGTALRDKYKDQATVEHIKRQRELEVKLAFKAKAKAEGRPAPQGVGQSPKRGKRDLAAPGGAAGSTFLTDTEAEGTAAPVTMMSKSASGARPKPKGGGFGSMGPPRPQPEPSRLPPRKPRHRKNKDKVPVSVNVNADANADVNANDLSSLMALDHVRRRRVTARNVLPMLLVVRASPKPALPTEAATLVETKAGEQMAQVQAQTKAPRVIEARSKLVSHAELPLKLSAIRRSMQLPGKLQALPHALSDAQAHDSVTQTHTHQLDISSVLAERPQRPEEHGRGRNRDAAAPQHQPSLSVEEDSPDYFNDDFEQDSTPPTPADDGGHRLLPGVQSPTATARAALARARANANTFLSPSRSFSPSSPVAASHSPEDLMAKLKVPL